ncbi:mitochondrial matrix iron-sulfur protein [Coemansia sp. RSA 1939]|nr:mitochondrial matrix iron-sulfur protein [Coemansia sp. RSA 1939]KAJ2610054.1 mitochondrial matrix iron-sulfur protein [Coemansia sp. RSA 1804]KAJ2689667.1 mitochondrial matrix iron-sulfur protein [Coemansia sp. RSA 1285]
MSILRLATARTAAVPFRPQNRILQQHTLPFSALAPVAKQVTVTFVEPDGAEIEATGEEGTNLMELAHENDVDLEGACEGACACSTCHVILEDKIYDELPEPSDEENDMLDLAFGLTDTSRLGCQVELTPDMEGMRIKLPSATRNFYVDGAKPAHH